MGSKRRGGSEGSRGSKRRERADSNAFYSATFLTVNSYCKFRSMDGIGRVRVWITLGLRPINSDSGSAQTRI